MSVRASACRSPFLIPYVIVHSAVLYSSRKLFGRTRRNNNGNDCEIKAAYVRDKTRFARAPLPLHRPSGRPIAYRARARARERRRNVFSFYTRDDHDTLALAALFFPPSLPPSLPPTLPLSLTLSPFFSPLFFFATRPLTLSRLLLTASGAL